MEHTAIGIGGALGMIGLPELVPILVIVLVLFGAKKLPELARAMGSSINQFKKGLSDGEDEPAQLGEGERAKGAGEAPGAATPVTPEKDETRVP